MTLAPDRPQLMLRRLAVYANGNTVYDESFHNGVNILRGRNSSGKSTIADLVFLAFGGDSHKWKAAALQCELILAELWASGAILTIRRRISETPRQAMEVFWGTFEEASTAVANGWQSYSFTRSESKESFSQLFFRALGLPEAPSDVNSNITMHQLLRLIYVDQMSSPQSLMRDERFDSALIRTTVGDLLFGYYDDSLYSDELELREKERYRDSTSRELVNLELILHEAEQEIDLSSIDRQIQEAEDQLLKIDSALQDRPDPLGITAESKGLDEIESLRQKVRSLREQQVNMESVLERKELEIQDSQLFIASLEKRLVGLDQSEVMRTAKNTFPMSNCPACLARLKPPVLNTCILCKEMLPPDERGSQLLRMKQELALQIRESKALSEEKKVEITRLHRQLPELTARTRQAQRSFAQATESVRVPRDSAIDALLIQKGALRSRLEFLHRQAKAISVVEQLRRRKHSLELSIGHLTDNIKSKKQRQEARRKTVAERIQYYAVRLLRSDLPREEAFSRSSEIVVDFRLNTFSVDGSNEFSASSITYLKNCVHFGIFFASLDLDFMRYPRLIVCDNMEDKGMEEARSQNFQTAVSRLSKEANVPHQIIFTTSMIAHELNTSPPCIGQQFDENHKSLRTERARQ